MQISGKILELVSTKNGFSIFKFNPDDQTNLPVGAMNKASTYMSCMGSADGLQKGMIIKIVGDFQINNYKPTNIFAQNQVPKLNFIFKQLEVIEGLNNESGLKDFFIKEIPFVGEKLADKIFEKYPADEIVKILSLPKIESIVKLNEIGGVGKKISIGIYDTWAELSDRREVLSDLFKYGFSIKKAMNIYDLFGQEAIKKIKENPYCVVRVRGIGFKQAEELAIQHFNIPKDSLNRYIALIDFHVRELCQADTLFSVGDLSSRVKDYLMNDDFEYTETNDEIVTKGLEGNIMNSNICKINEDIFMLHSYYNLEKKIAEKLISLKGEKNELKINVKEIKGFDFLTKEQGLAVKTILENKISILTGAAGTGKTTTTKVVVKGLEKSGYTYVCISPTNKAVKRIKEVNKEVQPDGSFKTIEASTIHSLLGLKRGSSTTKYNELNPLPYDYILIDESSMMGEQNASLILKALGKNSSIVFMGDKNQLSSVDSGSFFNDICESGLFSESLITLGVVKRTVDNGKDGSGEIIPGMNNLVANSQRILDVKAPISTNSNSYCKYYSEELYGSNAQNSNLPYNTIVNNDIVASLKKIYDKMIEKSIDYNKDYQILIPTYKGETGIDNINSIFSNYLNSKNPQIDLNGKLLRVGDKVYYDNKNETYGLVKGDTGYISDINKEGKKIKIFFYDLEKECEFNFMELDNIKLGYAMSVHKSQGSEFDYSSLIITSSSYSLLNNNVLYTGYTRGKKKTYLFAEKTALTIALNNKESARNTYLFNILSNIPDNEIEITKSRELKGISENQIKFVESKLNELYKKEDGRLVKVKPSTSLLAGFRFVYANKDFLSENGIFEKMELSEELYKKLEYNKDIRFIRLDNSEKEINGFYKAKLSNHFNHVIVAFNQDKKLRLITMKNNIKNVFNG